MALELKKRQKKETILACALDLFSKKGYLETPVRDLIDATGFGTSTFYRYFDDKEAVLKALLRDFFNIIMERVKEYYLTEEDLRVRFVETKRVVLEVFIEHRDCAALYARMSGVSDGIDACLKEFDDRYLAQVCDNIRYGIERGIFRDVTPEPVAHAILGFVKYAVYRWVVLKQITARGMITMAVKFHEYLGEGIFTKGQRGK